MNSRIMPPGYSIPKLRARRLEELLAKRADDLARASDADQKRIRKEIEAEVEREMGKILRGAGAPVLWSH